jgi:hypothetical protein
VDLSFSCARQSGAIFIPRARTDRISLDHTSNSLRQYIKDNYDHWCNFAIEKHAILQVRQNQVTLVYGCDKGAAWATAAFKSKSSGANLQFSTSLVPGVPSAQAHATWSNARSSSAISNWGPRSMSHMPRLSPTVAGHAFDDTCAYTFFIRSFRIKKGPMPFMGLKIEAQAGSHDIGGPHHDSDSSTSVIAGPRGSSIRDNEMIDVRN